MINTNNFLGRDLISINDLSIEEINYIMDFAKDIENNPFKFKDSMKGKIMAPLFFEQSTRTYSSFQAAMLKMDGKVIDFDVERSSVGKGETLRDTVKIIEGYEPDVFVVRHKKDGSVKFVADTIKVPVINAGDGKNQHPTQTLLDLYTIKEIRGKIDGVKIIIAGDLKYGRTAHSLALALSKYSGCELLFVSPDSLKMPEDILQKLKDANCSYKEYSLDEFSKVMEGAEILYATRVQRERFPEGPDGEYEYKKISEQYKIKLSMLKNVISGFKIMHPLPKISEIEESIDNTEYAYYFKQAKNGLYIRQALLNLLIK